MREGAVVVGDDREESSSESSSDEESCASDGNGSESEASMSAREVEKRTILRAGRRGEERLGAKVLDTVGLLVVDE